MMLLLSLFWSSRTATVCWENDMTLLLIVVLSFIAFACWRLLVVCLEDKHPKQWRLLERQNALGELYYKLQFKSAYSLFWTDTWLDKSGDKGACIAQMLERKKCHDEAISRIKIVKTTIISKD